MNKKQQVILSLLKEIDEICRKHQIEYFLSPRLTLCAVQEQPFPQNPLFGVVLMKVPEMERFRQFRCNATNVMMFLCWSMIT